MPDELEIRAFKDDAAFEKWLAKNHERSDGLWVKIAKKASGIQSITHPEALDVALCYGWIDGQRNALDDEYFLQRFTPRRKRSKWSTRNREYVERLTKAGRMQPAGQAEIDRAKADGRWEAAYDGPARIAVPDDLSEALGADPAAAKTFAGLSSANRYAILFRLHDAKKPETRARRMQTYLEMLREGRGPHDRV
ncbi:MAG TPA: YdeI/OmpD-associated family protein [Baekduia sp.]|nr:YdeI/OmpD-associated family protein [Baekduia sp.]